MSTANSARRPEVLHRRGRFTDCLTSGRFAWGSTSWAICTACWLARAIAASQQEEIQSLQGWRQDWYPDTAAVTVAAMMKMDLPRPRMTEQRFLAEMIPDHQGAIPMSQKALQQAEHPELRTMAQGIIEEQEKETAQMQTWLEDWTAER